MSLALRPHGRRRSIPRELRYTLTTREVLAGWITVDKTAGAGSTSLYVTDSRRSEDRTVLLAPQLGATQGETVKAPPLETALQCAVMEHGSAQFTHN